MTIAGFLTYLLLLIWSPTGLAILFMSMLVVLVLLWGRRVLERIHDGW